MTAFFKLQSTAKLKVTINVTKINGQSSNSIFVFLSETETGVCVWWWAGVGVQRRLRKLLWLFTVGGHRAPEPGRGFNPQGCSSRF